MSMKRRGTWRLVVAAAALAVLGYLVLQGQASRPPGVGGTGLEPSRDDRITKQSFSIPGGAAGEVSRSRAAL